MSGYKLKALSWGGTPHEGAPVFEVPPFTTPEGVTSLNADNELICTDLETGRTEFHVNGYCFCGMSWEIVLDEN